VYQSTPLATLMPKNYFTKWVSMDVVWWHLNQTSLCWIKPTGRCK
jgi:hypothetical protein